MRETMRFWSVTAVVLAALVPSVWAQSQDLQKAINLYDKQEYLAVLETLVKIDRARLSDAEKAEYDQLSSTIQDAIRGNKKSQQDKADADRAYAANRLDEADGLYQGVIANKYAKAADRKEAETQRQKIAERLRRGDPAAAPSGNTQATMAQDTSAPPQNPQRMTPVDELRNADDLRWQRAMAKMEELSNKAREAIADKRFNEARQMADAAQQIIEEARAYAEPASKYEAAKATAIALKQEVADMYEANEAVSREREAEEIKVRVAQREDLLKKQRAEKIEQLFNTAAQLRKEQQFAQSAEVLRQILYIDPANAKAQNQLEIMEDSASLWEQKELDQRRRREFQHTSAAADEYLTPYNVDVLYPRNWLELTERRRGAAVGVGRPEEDRELNRKLEEVIPDLSVEEQPFDQVLDYLREFTKVNMTVDWDDLTGQGVERTKTVTLKLKQLQFRQVLRELLSQVGGEVKLAYSIAGGLLRIATKEKLDKDKLILVYDIRDLLVEIPRFVNPNRLDIGQALSQIGQGGQGGGGGGGQNIFQSQGGGGGGQGGRQTEGGAGGAQAGGRGLIEEIMDILRQTVEPDSWRETGAGDGSLRELNGQLIVYNTSDAHRQVADLLTQLRATRALQIAIESRFLTVTNNFLEEIGVDLDFVLNSGSAGFDRAFNGAGAQIVDPFTGAPVLMPRQFSRIGATASPPGVGTPLTQVGNVGQPYGRAALVPFGTGIPPQFDNTTPISIGQSSLPLVDAANLNTTVPGSLIGPARASPAMNIAGSFLDNLQVDFLIRATQANARSSIVQSPRLLMFNGQRANISVGRTQQYVSSVTPQLAEGVASVTPVINSAFSGTSLDVEGTISADRKYVTLTVQTQQLRDPRFSRFEVQRQSGNSPGIFVTLLDQETADINTTVSIPDGGTVLLGGLKLAGEIEVEAGVPILSNIPILKRAFTNTTMVKDTQTLLILIKSKIIIQPEAEEEAFPTFSSTGG